MSLNFLVEEPKSYVLSVFGIMLDPVSITPDPFASISIFSFDLCPVILLSSYVMAPVAKLSNVTKLKVPDPFVCKYCPLLPSPVGKVN